MILEAWKCNQRDIRPKIILVGKATDDFDKASPVCLSDHSSVRPKTIEAQIRINFAFYRAFELFTFQSKEY